MVKVYDEEGVQTSELIGCAQIYLRDLEPGKVKDVWLKLVKDLDIQRDNKNRGQVRKFSFSSNHEFCEYKERNLTCSTLDYKE